MSSNLELGFVLKPLLAKVVPDSSNSQSWKRVVFLGPVHRGLCPVGRRWTEFLEVVSIFSAGPVAKETLQFSERIKREALQDDWSG